MRKRTKKKFVSVLLTLIIIALLIGVFVIASYQYSTIKIDRVTVKFEKEGYDITTSNLILNALELTLGLAGVEKIVEIFVASKDDDNITVLYFASSDDAETAYAELKDDDMENLGIRGKTVYYGTLNSVKIYKKMLF